MFFINAGQTDEEGTRLSQIPKLQPGRQSHDKRHRKSMRFTACKDILVLPYLQQMMCLVAPPVHYGNRPLIKI